ncbi:MAG TPA: hypothetical protein VNE41_08645 [Chitinophagaceae bacterium]|nr:hypothetical protein [Chitinophagaceae bacterium]
MIFFTGKFPELSLLLFCIYFLALHFLVRKNRFIRDCGLPPLAITGLFMLKIAACIGFALFSLHHSESLDSRSFYLTAYWEYIRLIRAPLAYFRQMPADYRLHLHALGAVFDSHHSFWGYASRQIMLKIMIGFNLLTGGNYYTDLLLYSYPVFIGHIALYRFFRSYALVPPVLLLLAVFFLPSLLVWTSNYDKEGILLVALGLLFFHFDAWLQHRKPPGKIFIGLLCFGLILLVRNYFAIILVPVLAAWAISVKWKKWPAPVVFLAVYLLAGLVFFNLGRISPSLNIPDKLVGRQMDFRVLSGRSRISLPPLDPSPLGFLRLLPKALNHAILRPYFWESRHWLYLAAGLENGLILAIFLLSLITFRGWSSLRQPAVLGCLVFSLSILLVTGYEVPFLGAIIRYRSLALPFLLGSAFSWMDWETLRKYWIKYISFINIH